MLCACRLVYRFRRFPRFAPLYPFLLYPPMPGTHCRQRANTKKGAKPAPFNDLPGNILLRIFDVLQRDSIQSVVLVSRRFRDIALRSDALALSAVTFVPAFVTVVPAKTDEDPVPVDVEMLRTTTRRRQEVKVRLGHDLACETNYSAKCGHRAGSR